MILLILRYQVIVYILKDSKFELLPNQKQKHLCKSFFKKVCETPKQC